MEEIRGIKRVGNLTLGVFTKLCEKGQMFFGKNLPETIIKAIEKKEEQISAMIEVEIFLRHNHDPAIAAEEERRSRP